MINDKSVVIIGNSGSVLEHYLGETIDSYDVVIRLNNCPTIDYEKFIGKKINIWATTKNNTFSNFVPPEHDSLDWIWHRTIDTKRQTTLPHQNIPSMIMYKNKFFNDNFKEYGQKFHRTTNHELCTGMLAILTSTIFFKNVDITGFNFYQSLNCKDKGEYAYYRCKQANKNDEHFEDEAHQANKKMGFTSAKVAKAKKEILDDLVRKGKINFLKK